VDGHFGYTLDALGGVCMHPLHRSHIRIIDSSLISIQMTDLDHHSDIGNHGVLCRTQEPAAPTRLDHAFPYHHHSSCRRTFATHLRARHSRSRPPEVPPGPPGISTDGQHRPEEATEKSLHSSDPIRRPTSAEGMRSSRLQLTHGGVGIAGQATNTRELNRRSQDVAGGVLSRPIRPR